ncbi:MAG: hypothetical protein PHR26_00035 [Candidatus ainarchaeum sp.]|nr:hypothetical protein [Candidatus ainarchaeum sp.]MDD3976088.1 hypothetical protein [Candidatus ainarchaeum sp.]
MKIVFDSGVLITFSETCFLGLFEDLKKELGEFIITNSVLDESVLRAKKIMRFKLSGIRIEEKINFNVFNIFKGSKELDEVTKKILELTNNMFYINNRPLKIIQLGEAECLALLGLTNANYLAVDERTTRMLIEQPHGLLKILKRKNNTNKISFDENKYIKFKELIGNVNAIRSVDLLAFAYKKKLLKDLYLNKENIKASLYAFKFRGCSVSFEEINEFVDNL